MTNDATSTVPEQPAEPVIAAAPAAPAYQTAYPTAPTSSPYGAPQTAYVPMHAGTGEPGKIRGTGVSLLLMIVTFGIYSLVWFYKTHSEMKRHSGAGLGGGLALVLTLFVGIVMPFITASEVGGLYERRGQKKPVSGATGLWYFPGAMILVGPIVWFVKTNGALNAYWRSLGAR